MSLLKPLTLALLAAAIAGCSNLPNSTAKSAEATPDNEDWYQVRTENELYLFDDYSVFREFLDTGKAPYLKDLEQKDKYGQSIVLGLRAEDRDKDLTKVAAHRFLQVSQPPASKFYGEIRQEGVIYVFARYGDMIDMNKIGEPIFSHTEIASGPNGERVVYVLAKEEKKPVEQIKLFQSKYKRA
ncbi:MAG: hypothetical protein V4812_16025 [Pseudomonadota bacterium]